MVTAPVTRWPHRLLPLAMAGAVACTGAGSDRRLESPPPRPDAAASAHDSSPAASSARERVYVVRAERSRVRVVANSLMGEHPMTVGQLRGRALVVSNDLTQSRVEVELDTRSVRTGSQLLTALVLSERVLDVARYPTARFVSRRIRRVPKAADRFRLEGELTLHGVTRSVAMDARVHRKGDAVVALTTFSVRRQDFGIRPGGLLGVLVHDEVRVELELWAEARETR